METKWYIKRPHLQEGYIKLKKIKIGGWIGRFEVDFLCSCLRRRGSLIG